MTDPRTGPEDDPDASGAGGASESSAGRPTTVAELTEAELYVLLRKAIEDAILGAIGTVLLVGIGTVLAYAGLSAALIGARDAEPAVTAGGLAVGVFGCYVAAATLGLVPSVREWW